MPEIEPTSFCSIDEYQRYLMKRIQAHDIALNGLYLVMAALVGKKEGKEAFKFPVIIYDVELQDAGKAKLSADLLDKDLQPKQYTEMEMIDGFLTRPGFREITSNQMAKGMYIKDYEDFYDSSFETEAFAGNVAPVELSMA